MAQDMIYPGEGSVAHEVKLKFIVLGCCVFIFIHFYAYFVEKEMATHSSVLAWRIPGTVEPGGLPSLGLHRVGHD